MSNHVGFRFSERAPEKAALAALFCSIAFLSVLYREIYPLELGQTTGYLAQIPVVFWFVIVAAIGAGVFVCVATTSNLVKFGAVVVTAVLINYKQFLFFNFTGGDAASETARWFIIGGLPQFSVELFSYFQWPAHFLYFETVNKLLALPLMDTIRLSYLLLYVSFVIGVMYFFHSHTSSSFWAAASLVYTVYMMQLLNNQLVPQLFALVVLLFLFGIGSVITIRTRILQFLLYMILVLSHPFFFVFYLFYLAVHPFVVSARTQLMEHGTTGFTKWSNAQPAITDTDEPVYRSVIGVLSTPFRSLKRWISNGLSEFVRRSLFPLATMVSVYLILFSSRFVFLQEQVYARLTAGGSSSGTSGRSLARVFTLLFGESNSDTASEPTRLLYELSSETLHTISAYVVLGLFLSLLAVALVAFFRKPINRVSPTQISAGLAGTIYYIVGFSLPIIGSRALQVAMLPIGTLLAGREADARVIKAIVLIALLVSPMVGANAMINASISGGGNTQSYHAHVAGEHLAQHDVDIEGFVLTYPHSGLPPDFTERQDEKVVSIGEVLRYPTRPATIVYGPRQDHVATKFRSNCDFDSERRNRVYDNDISVLTESNRIGRLNCTVGGAIDQN